MALFVFTMGFAVWDEVSSGDGGEDRCLAVVEPGRVAIDPQPVRVEIRPSRPLEGAHRLVVPPRSGIEVGRYLPTGGGRWAATLGTHDARPGAWEVILSGESGDCRGRIEIAALGGPSAAAGTGGAS